MFPHRTAPRLTRAVCSVNKFLAAAVLLFALHAHAQAAGTFVPAPGRVDVVYDSARDTLYVTSGGSVLRYHLGTGAFLAPLELGGSLAGIDLSPDGRTLAVADRQRSSSSVWVHVVDLPTGQRQAVSFPRGFGEGGTFTVAFGADGRLLVTSTYEGSGWVQLRRYDPATGETDVVAPSVTQNTMLAASGDGSAVGFVESNISDGRFGRYRVVGAPEHGTLTGTAPDLVYTPHADYNGPDSFTFKANDGAADSAPATVSISVLAVNDRPTAAPDAATAVKNTPLTIAVLANDTDVDGDALTVAAVTQPSAGTVSIASGRTGVVFTPRYNFLGAVSFNYTASDGRGGAATATVTVTVVKR